MREHCRALFHFLSTKRALNAQKTGDAPSTKSLKNEHYLHRPTSEATLFSLQDEECRVQTHRFSGRLAMASGKGISERNPASKIDQHRPGA